MLSFFLILAGILAARPVPLIGHIGAGAGFLLMLFSVPPVLREVALSPETPPARKSIWPFCYFFFALFVATLLGMFRPEPRAPVFWWWCAGLLLLLSWSLFRVFRGATIGKAEIVPGIFLSLLAFIINFSFLADIPRAVHGDVGEIAIRARTMNPASTTLTVTDWALIPGLHNLIAKTGFLFADGLAAARFSDAFCGVLAGILLFLLLRMWISLPAGIMTVVLFICSANLIHTFRVGLGLGPPILLSVAALFCYWKAQNQRRMGFEYAVLSGIICGLALQVNFAARIIPLLLVVFTAHQMVFSRQWKRPMLLLTIAGLTAVLVAGPILAYYFHHPQLINSRQRVFIFAGAGYQRESWVFHTASRPAIFLYSLVRALGMFHFFPDPMYGDFYIGESGFFEPVTAAFFLLGVAVSLRLFKDSRFAWPLTGCLLSLLLLVSITTNAPAYHRAGPAVLFACVLAGFGIEAFLRAHIFERKYSMILAALLAAAGAGWGVQRYFFDYVKREFPNQNTITSIARRISEEPVESTRIYMLGLPVFYFNHGTIRFLAGGYKGIDIKPGDSFPEVETLEGGTNLFIAIDSRASELEEFARRAGGGCIEDHPVTENPDRGFKVFKIEVSRGESGDKKISACGRTL